MRQIRVLIAKVGLDGHDRGAWIVIEGLQRAGMSVSYSGLHASVSQIVDQAIREQVDVLGISCLSGAHREYFPRIAWTLAQQNHAKICLLGGGLIPSCDIPFLEEWGYQLFPTGATIKEIISYIEQWYRNNHYLQNREKKLIWK